jgi:threonine synthase
MKLKYKSGNTPLIKIDSLCERFNLDNILIKDESKNPFGTFKDRISEFIIKKAIDKHIGKLAIITAGNAGYSLSKFAEGTNIKVVCLIDKSFRNSTKKKLQEVTYKLIEVDLSKNILKPEQVISLARENDEEVIWDVTNGYHEVYESIIQEIKKENPDYVIIPVGSGEGLVGLYSGINKYKLKTKLIGVGVKQKWYSYADKLWTPWTPYKSKIEAIVKEGHQYIELDEDEIKRTYEGFKGAIDCEPSSAVVFAALSKIKFNKKDKIILINTGKGII